MTLWSPMVSSRSGFPLKRELQLIRPHTFDDSKFPLLPVSMVHHARLTGRQWHLVIPQCRNRSRWWNAVFRVSAKV